MKRDQKVTKVIQEHMDFQDLRVNMVQWVHQESMVQKENAGRTEILGLWDVQVSIDSKISI